MPSVTKRPCAEPGCKYLKPCPVHRTRVRLYNRRAWRSGARVYLLMHPYCATGCGRLATQVDHVVAHQGVERLFWDRSNWQGLCAACHAKKGHSER